MPDDDADHAPPHDDDADEPLGPFTPDEVTPAGDTPETAHDEVGPHDLPKDHPGRPELIEEIGEDGTTKGNV